MHLRNYFQTIHWALTETFYQSSWIWKVNGRLQFPKNPTHQCTTMLLMESSWYLTMKVSTLSKFYYLQPSFNPPITDFFIAMNTLIQGRYNHNENCITVKVSRKTEKVVICLASEGSGLALFFADLRQIFGSNVGNEFGVMLRGKRPHKQKFAYIVRIHSLMIYTDLIKYNIVGDTRPPLLRCFLFFEAQVWRHFNYWTVHELSDNYQPAIQTAAQKFFS